SSAATHDSANAKPTIIATRLITVPSPRGDPKVPAGHLGARTLREPYAAHRLPSGDPEPPSGRRSAAARSRSAGRVRPDAADLEPLARLLGPALEPRGKALEAHLDAAALPQARPQPQLAAVLLHEAPAHGQADPDPASPAEAVLEGPPHRLLRHARAVVAHPHDRLVVVGAEAHLHAVGSTHRLQGVADQVANHLHQALRVTDDLEPPAEVEPDARVLVGHAEHDVPQVDYPRLERALELPTRQDQQVLRGTQQLARALGGGAHVGVVGISLPDRAEVVVHQRQWCRQLVRDLEQETTLGLLALPDRVERAVEGVDEVAD